MCVCIIVGGHKPSSTRYPTLFSSLPLLLLSSLGRASLPTLAMENVPASQRGQTRPIWIRSGTHIHTYSQTHTQYSCCGKQHSNTLTHTTKLTNYKKQEEKQSGERESQGKRVVCRKESQGGSWGRGRRLIGGREKIAKHFET